MFKLKKIFRLRFLLILLAVFASAIIYAKISPKTKDFRQAEDFPRDALFYVQIQDLPAFIKLWNESELKKKYLESANFAEFRSNHLALKLVERWNETNNAVGFSLDTAVLSGLCENKAAFAFYDIGKLEIVFIAPMSDEKILATSFFQSAANFEEMTLEDGTIVYSLEAEVDRGRQTQKILFANFRGRFVLATSEKYFLQTLENIKGKSPNNRLSAEISFKQLAEKTKPNLATVWLNQAKLNDDWYFKNYWLPSDSADLKNFRAGMFDFEMREDKLVERRVFLTNENNLTAKIQPESAKRFLEIIPSNVPFYRIQTIEKKNLGNLVSETLFDVKNSPQTETRDSQKETYYFEDWEKSYSYSWLDSDFEKQIDDEADKDSETEDFQSKTADKLDARLQEIIGEAQPSALANILSPKVLPSPLFFDNRKSLIISLQNPSNINREKLEKILGEMAKNYFTAGYLKADFEWKNLPGAEFQARQMTMPSLGWKIFYAFRGKELIFSNSEDLLKDIFSAKENKTKINASFDKLSVIRLSEREKSFDEIMKKLRAEEAKSGETTNFDFFDDNIGSLLDVISDVERIEIRRNSSEKFIYEEIDFILKPKTENTN